MENKNEASEPQVFNTHDPLIRAHFERYNGETSFENGEPEFDDVRLEIAAHYGVSIPAEDEDMGEKDGGHIFIPLEIIPPPRSAGRGLPLGNNPRGD